MTEIKVYSNQPEVSLYVDGAPAGRKEGMGVFVFEVPIAGEHTICAVARGCEDSIAVRKVDAADPAYQFGKRAA